MKNTITNGASVHVFQSAGLGTGPFKLSHVTAEGGRCEFCNTSILWRFYIKDQNGGTFFVGSDCVMKTGDAGLMKVVEAEVKRRQGEARKAKEAEKMSNLRAILSDPATVAKLQGMPHPNAWYASKGRTMKDYADWIMRFGGKTAQLGLLKFCK